MRFLGPYCRYRQTDKLYHVMYMLCGGLTVFVDELVEEAKGTLAGLQTSIVHDGEDTSDHRTGSTSAGDTYIHTYIHKTVGFHCSDINHRRKVG